MCEQNDIEACSPCSTETQQGARKQHEHENSTHGKGGDRGIYLLHKSNVQHALQMLLGQSQQLLPRARVLQCTVAHRLRLGPVRVAGQAQHLRRRRSQEAGPGSMLGASICNYITLKRIHIAWDTKGLQQELGLHLTCTRILGI